MRSPLHSTAAGHPDRSLPMMSALSGFLADLKKPAHLLVAISGGSDSTGLLLGLHSALASFPDIRICAATIDHALRPEAVAEAQAVSRICADLGIPHVTRRWEGEKPASGISAAAREARYSLLSAVADEIGATAIVTGHTAGDQVETVMMRGARGKSPLQPLPQGGVLNPGDPLRFILGRRSPQGFSSLAPEMAGGPEGALGFMEDGAQFPGLSGMAPATLLDARHWIFRPLLRTSRADIRAWLTHNGLGWIDDPSNLDTHYERVRIRQLLSSGKAAIDPGVIDDAAQARAQLAQGAADWLAAFATVDHAVLAKIAPAGLAENPATIRHALSTLAAVLGGRPYAVSRENGERLMTFIASGTHGRMTAGRVVFDIRRDGLYMLRENRNLPDLIVQPGKAAMWDSRFLIANHSSQPIEVLPGRGDPADFENAPPGLARLAARVSARVSDPGHADVSIWPHLMPFDRFLPVFDLPLASRIAALMGRDPYLLPPV